MAEETIQDDDELRLTQRFLPIGVIGAICPWNFPLVLAVGKISASLITGNCIIVKPSPYTPYSILKFAEFAQAVLPHGVLQTLNGDESLGPLMTTHPGIGKISFTGSTGTGKRIMEAASRTLKSVTLELGGNSAVIVCVDVDVTALAQQIAIGAFFNSGQFCLASKRIYVHERIYDKFRDAIAAVMKSWKAGPAFEKDSMLGPVQNKMQYDIVLGFFEDCKQNGYTFALDGGPSGDEGFIVQPAIVDNPPDSSWIVTGEPFGKTQSQRFVPIS
jgi:acyl-CoA reductase-like NAD-dependent aldehyde dehydrogenase